MRVNRYYGNDSRYFRTLNKEFVRLEIADTVSCRQEGMLLSSDKARAKKGGLTTAQSLRHRANGTKRIAFIFRRHVPSLAPARSRLPSPKSVVFSSPTIRH